MADLLFHAIFTASKAGKTGLTVTVDVDKVERATGTRTALVTGGSATEGRDGHYYYRQAGVTDLQTFDYLACFKTADATVDLQNVHAGWFPFPLAYAAELARLDAAITTRSAFNPASDQVALSAAAILALLQALFDTDSQREYSDAVDGSAIKEVLDGVPPASMVYSDSLANDVPGSYASGTAGWALGRIGRGTINVTSPVAANGDVTTYQDAYYDADYGTALEWEDEEASWPDLTGATIKTIIEGVAEFTGAVVTPTGAGKTVRQELTGANSTSITVGKFKFQVWAEWAAPATVHKHPLVSGVWTSNARLEV